MSKFWKIGFITIVLPLFLITPSFGYFKEIGSGARPLGMAGAYTAVVDDGNAVFWNAAGLAQLKKQELYAMYSLLYTGLNAKLYDGEEFQTDQLGCHFISYANPSKQKIGTFGFSWATFQSRFYEENTFLLSYGRKLTSGTCFGINVKRLSWSVEGNKYTREDKDVSDAGDSKAGLTLDVGLLFNISKLSIGISAENLLPADLGLIVEERIPINFRFGVAYRYKTDSQSEDNAVYITPACDIVVRSSLSGKSSETSTSLGTEFWFFDRTLAVRAGLGLHSIASGLSYRVAHGQFEMELDYAFLYPLRSIRWTYGSHRMAVAMRF